MGNRNSSSKDASTEPQHIVQKQGRSSASGWVVDFETEQGHGGTKVSSFRDVYIGNGPLDNDDTFNDYILRAKKKIRSSTMSNNVWEQSNAAPTPEPVEDASGTSSSKEENEREKFSKFIQITKKKLRTTSSLRNNSFFQRGQKP